MIHNKATILPEVQMKSLRRPGLVMTALLIASVNLLGAPPSASPVPAHSLAAQGGAGQSEIESEIAKARDLWVTEWNLRQINQVMALYAPDAMFLTASGERAVGQAAIRNLFESMRNSNMSNLRLHSLAVEQSGDLAYDSGSYRETAALPDNPRHEIAGSYLAVYKLQPEGRWLIVQHVWTGASPPHVEFKPLVEP
jgi:ketosteroid isomerase-like protein